MITDKRQFSAHYPVNHPLIKQVTLDLQQSATPSLSLQDLVTTLLIQQKNDVINIGCHLAPNAMVANIIWQALHQAINMTSTQCCQYWAIPLIMMCTSENRYSIPLYINSQPLNLLLQQAGLTDNIMMDKIFIYDECALNKITYSMLYHYNRSRNILPIIHQSDLTDENSFCGEPVILRFIIGRSSNAVCFEQRTLAFNNKLIKILSAYLQPLYNGLTVIPCNIVPLSLAVDVGTEFFIELHLAIKLSKIVRELRQLNIEPMVFLSSHPAGINIAIIVEEHQYISFEWPIAHTANFYTHYHKLSILLQDMQLNIIKTSQTL